MIESSLKRSVSQAPVQTNFEVSCTISADLFKGEVFTPHGGRLLNFLFAGVVCGLLPARQCLHVMNVAAPKSPADNMWAESSCRKLRFPARRVVPLCRACGLCPSDLEPGFLRRPACGSLHACMSWAQAEPEACRPGGVASHTCGSLRAPACCG